MKNSTVIKTFFIVVSLVFSLHSSNLYPDWFIYQQRYPGLVVGYSYQGHDAEQNAESLFCAYRDCIAWGSLGIFDMEGNQDFLKNSDYFYYFSPDSLEKIRGHLKAVDLFETNIFSGDYIAAFYPDTALQINSQKLKPEEIPRPAWVDRTFWQDDQFYYGVGMYTSIGLENDAWKTAEEQAIFAILNALAVQVGQIDIQTDLGADNNPNAGREEISVIRIKYRLKNINVLERYPDFKNKIFYVLVRIPKNGVWSPMMSH